MRERFTCPKFSDLPREDWPFCFQTDPTDLMRSVNSTTGIQVHVNTPMLHRIDDRVAGTVRQWWRVTACMREINSDNAVLVESSASVCNEDTPESVQHQFFNVLLDAINDMTHEEEPSND